MTAVADDGLLDLVDHLASQLRDESGDLLGAAAVHARAAAPLLSPDLHGRIARQAVAAATGCGPLERHLARPDVREVLVNAGREVWVEDRLGLRRASDLTEGELGPIIERILLPLGKRLDRTSPIVDARLADGSRVCAAIPPVTPDGPCLAIRRFGSVGADLHDFGDANCTGVLRDIVDRRLNAVVSGRSSSGKTTLVGALCRAVPDDERIVAVEDVAEIRFGHGHVLRLEVPPHGADGGGAVSLGDLLRAALRLRPDRLVVGEVRGAEAADMVAALNTGHDGSFTTCHANSARDAARRIEALVLAHHPQWTRDAVREHVARAIDVVIHVERGTDGRRRVADVVELSDDPGAAVRTVLERGVRTGDLRRTRRALHP
jgi:pilus assembly protein CpaF